MKKWKDIADHKAGCPYRGVAVYGTAEEMARYHSGVCPGCNRPVQWEEDEPSRGPRPSKDVDHHDRPIDPSESGTGQRSRTVLPE